MSVPTPAKTPPVGFYATLDKALEAKPAAFSVVQLPNGEFIPVGSGSDEREIKRTLGGTTVWFR